MRILTVDDELLIAEGIKREVESHFSDAKVDAVTSADEAVHGKMNLPSCGKEFFPHTVSRIFTAW